MEDASFVSGSENFLLKQNKMEAKDTISLQGRVEKSLAAAKMLFLALSWTGLVYLLGYFACVLETQALN